MQSFDHKVFISQIDVLDHRLCQVSVEPRDESQNLYTSRLMTLYHSRRFENLRIHSLAIDYSYQYF